nr:gamma-glutamylcyclotransferase family protein [uncultured Desulfobulbus sp.]
MKRLYFAYGSNMHLAQMRDRCPKSPLVGPGLLCGYRWIITTRGYANIVADSQAMVEGLLFQLDPEDERRLDGFEGVHLGNYRKVSVRVLSNREELNALTYIDPITTEGLPKGEYVGRINAAVRDAQLSPRYLHEVIRHYIPAS